MQPLGGKDMPLDPVVKRAKSMNAGADLVGERRQAEVDPLADVTLRLPVEWLMLPVLLKQDHREQARAEGAAGRWMERRRRLGDRLAPPAGELLPDRLDHLPLPRDHLQRLGDVLAELRQSGRAAARARGRRRNDHPLPRQMLRERLLRGTLADEGLHDRRLRRGLFGRQFVLGRGRLGVLELHLQLVEETRLLLRTRSIELTLELLDLQRQMRDQRLGVRGLRPSVGHFGLRQISTPFGRCKSGLQGSDVVRRGGHGGRLEAVLGKVDSATEPLQHKEFMLSDRTRAPGSLRMAPVDPLEQVAELRRRDRHRPIRWRRPDEAAAL